MALALRRRLALFRTLTFQIAAALLAIVSLFGLALYATSMALEKQRDSNILLSLAARLQLTSERIATQGMNYKENAPRDYETYHRDVRLYYQDLMSHVMTFDAISEAFMYGRFDRELTGIDTMMQPELSDTTLEAINRLQATWKQYRQGLDSALGPDGQEPRLEYAAQYVIEHHDTLNAAADGLMDAYQSQVSEELARIKRINRIAWTTGALLTLGLILWFYRQVLGPLRRTVAGFRRVSQGDFGHQVETHSDNELAWMTDSFNRLSSRLHAIIRLIERIQRGSDLDDVLGFISEEFPALLPLDWVGALFVTGDGSSIKLERAYVDGHSQVIPHAHFSLEGTLLQKALSCGEPLHIPDIPHMAETSVHYRFLRLLSGARVRDAIFLPITEQSPLPGVLVFGSRRAHAYSSDHLELLTNIAGLVTHTFGRTLRLAEHARLATIGHFVSGITHEIRSPLATISLALDYFCRIELPESATKRAQLARREAARVARLVEDMLTYAKPLSLNLAPLDLRVLVEDFIETHAGLADDRGQTLRLTPDGPLGKILGDQDRLFQVLLNLVRNACEAAPEGSSIELQLDHRPEVGIATLSVCNPGPPLDPQTLERLTEPFFTTKRLGTGLGLAIVKRLVDAHGGEIRFASDVVSGTRVSVNLPLADPG
jgi:signal transduction histidine kinase